MELNRKILIFSKTFASESVWSLDGWTQNPIRSADRSV